MDGTKIDRNRREPSRALAPGFAAIVIAGLTVTAPVSAHHPQGEAMAGMPSEAVRHHSLQTLKGERVSLAQLEGQVVVLNFWASWCAPCRKELPRLAALHEAISKRGGRVLAISVDQDRVNVERFVKRHRLALPVCHDGPDGLAQALELEHVPFTIVLDRSGAIAFTSNGADRQALDALAAATHRLIAGEPPIARTGEREAR